LWDAATGREVRSLTGQAYPVWCVAFSPDGSRLVSGSAALDRRQGEIRMWDVASGAAAALSFGNTGPVWGVAFSDNGRRIGSAGREVKLWDAGTSEEIFTLPGPPDDYRTLVFAPDGRHLLAAGQAGSIRIWDAADSPSRCESAATAHPDGNSGRSFTVP